MPEDNDPVKCTIKDGTCAKKVSKILGAKKGKSVHSGGGFQKKKYKIPAVKKKTIKEERHQNVRFMSNEPQTESYGSGEM